MEDFDRLKAQKNAIVAREAGPPTLVELLRHKIENAGPRDRTVNIKIAIGTARMMLEAEDERRRFKPPCQLCDTPSDCVSRGACQPEE